MENFLLDILKYGGPAGLALVIMFLLFREFVNKNIFPKLERHQAYRLLAFFLFAVWSVVIALIIKPYITPSPITVPTVACENLPTRFVHASGSFEKTSGLSWIEKPGNFSFSEEGCYKDYVYFVDASRLKDGDTARPITVRIPLNGGMAQWSYPNPWQWQDLYLVHRAS